MAPKSPWNKKAALANTNVQRQSSKAEVAAPAINYDEVQNDELQALEAIYGDDYEQIEVKGAWSKPTDRSFKLKLKAAPEDEDYVTLTVRLTATYPKTVPILQVEDLNGWHERTQQRIRNIVTNRPKQLLGQVMVFEIASEIRDALEDAIQAKQQGTLPSLEDERANAEQASTLMAKEVEEAEARRAQEEKDEEERMLKKMVEDEIHRREARKPSKPDQDQPLDTNTRPDIVTFDQPVILQTSSEKISFSQVRLLTSLSRTREEQIYLSMPVSPAQATALVSVKRRTLEGKQRDEVMELEAALEAVQKLRHSGILSILAFRIDRLDLSNSELIVCGEYAARGSLHDLLELGALHIDKARQFTVELLEAIDFLHRNGVAHGLLNTINVVIVDGPTPSPKLAEFGYPQFLQGHNEAQSKWQAPDGDKTSTAAQRKSDIWDFGKVVAQMFLGSQITTQYSSPQLMLSRLDCSDSFDDFLRKMFVVESKKRPSAFDLLAAEFLRTNDPVMEQDQLTAPPTLRSSSGGGSSFFTSPGKRRSRHNSSNILDPVSRYAQEFTEISRLGKGGFGEVVKARNKLDGGLYAIKKVKKAPHLLDQVISEVMVLQKLNHPFVVRYFSTWIEDDVSGNVVEDSTTETETATDTVTNDDDGPRIDFGYQSTGGLDFVSSAGYPQIEFGEDSDQDDSEAVEDDDDEANERCDKPKQNGVVDSVEPSEAGNLRLRKSRSDSRRAASTLYIQMEYCERLTLRNLIRKTMSADDAWRMVRQITEGLAHIHGHGIIHRDLKPDNIFIDSASSPKIGDFGLATTAHQQVADRAANMSGYSAGDMTRSVGTTLYVAPELRSASNTTYNDKVDMYSLGIMFFEMCEPFDTAMERIRAIQAIREKDHQLPSIFQAQGEKAAQGKLISCLISHKPSERPSSGELLRSDLLPTKIEDETILKALSDLSDPRSPYHQRMMSALFSREHATSNSNRVRAMAWEAKASGIVEDAKRRRVRNIARQALVSVFRRHGGEDIHRQTMFPESDYYANANAVQLVDASGDILQLRYDLTLPYARQLGKQPTDARCSYTIGNAYRANPTGGPPRVSEEVDFDIVDHGDGDDERTRNEVEVLKVMDEITCEMPLFTSSTTISFHLNDERILNAILEHCRIPIVQQPAVKEIISKLGFHQHTWSKVRIELRKFGLPDTTLDDLQQFDFRDSADKAFTRLRTLLNAAAVRARSRLDTGIHHLSEVVRISKGFDLKRKIYVSPLGSVNAKFYEDSFLFQCVLERKSNRVVIAAGGRYDSLIRAHRAPDFRTTLPGAVGVSIGLDPVIGNMAKSGETTKKAFLKNQQDEVPMEKRCDVLVLAKGNDAVRMTGDKLATALWASDVSAELAIGRHHHDYNFVVTVRHEASSTVRVTNTNLDSDEADIPTSGLVSYLQQEIRELESHKLRTALLRQPSYSEGERKSNVHVLIARHGSKKSNKYQIVSDAQERWSRKLDTMKDVPILAVETRDDVLDLVQQTRFSDPETWRRAVQSVQLNDRQYVQQIQEMLMSWRQTWVEGNGVREACVFNFRTQYCVYYDLSL